MSKKIQRVPNTCANEIKGLTDELKRAQTKHTLAKLYEKVLDYGSELVLKECNCVENPEANRLLRNYTGENDVPDSFFTVPKPSRVIADKRHDLDETLKKNAQFLMKSSRKLPDYPSELLSSMEDAFERNDFHMVIEFAVQHDGTQRRRFKHESDQGKSKKQIQNEVDEVNRELSFRCNWSKLLDEILAEKPLEKTALGHCVSAIKALSGELTYDARSEAKKSLAIAITMLENGS